MTVVPDSKKDKFGTFMQKLLGVEMNRMWTIWMIFIIRIITSPLNFIMGFIFECSDAEILPDLMVVSGALEIIWALVTLYLHVYQPYKEMKGGSKLKSTYYWPLTIVMIISSLGIFALVIAIQIFLAGVPASSLDETCDGPVFIGCYIWLGFKYLDILKFFVIFFFVYIKR